MVKKLKRMADAKKTSPASLFDSELAGNVKESAQQIWLAGMGAFSKAQAEGGKVFEALVSEGAKLQRKTQSIAEDRLSEVAGKMTAVADTVTGKAGAHWDKLETIFEDRVARSLNKLGVPSRADVDALIKRIDALSAMLEGGKTKATASVKRRAKPVAKEAAAAVKRAVTKPAARKRATAKR